MDPSIASNSEEDANVDLSNTEENAHASSASEECNGNVVLDPSSAREYTGNVASSSKEDAKSELSSTEGNAHASFCSEECNTTLDQSSVTSQSCSTKHISSKACSSKEDAKSEIFFSLGRNSEASSSSEEDTTALHLSSVSLPSSCSREHTSPSKVNSNFEPSCYICRKRFLTISSLIKHLFESHRSRSSNTYTTPSIPANISQHLQQGESISTSDSEVLLTGRTSNGKEFTYRYYANAQFPFECAMGSCREKFKWKLELMRHMERYA